jgi:ribosomal protein S18 acetylase RimI-like enzyme
MYTITEALSSDLTALVELINSAYRGDSSRSGWTTEADILGGKRTDETVLQSDLDQPGAQMLKLVEDDELNACVYLQHISEKLYVGMLTVRPTLQNKGYGKILLQKAEEIAKNLGCTKMAMTVISVRKELIDWYQRNGYSPTGETKPFVVGIHIGEPVQPLEFLTLEKPI